MPYLERMTFTGVDERTDIAELLILHNKFAEDRYNSKIIEFGFLYSHNDQGKQNKYPSFSFLTKMGKLNKALDLNFALHLCGTAASSYLFEEDTELTELAGRFTRVQLNINGNKLQKEGIDNTVLAEKIVEGNHSLPEIILQCNSVNEWLCTLLNSLENYDPNLLFDTSGGLGKSPDSWPKPLNQSYCSYAGGLGPDTLMQDLLDISKVTGGCIEGIDMESKVRTNDWFDLYKVKTCLDIWDKFNEV